MNYVTIDIKNPDDSLFLKVSVTKECEHVQELMTADYVQLSWVSVDYAVIPAGSYIEHEGVQMRLLEPYYPTIKSDEEWEYKPQFHGIVGQLKKLPFMFVNDESGTPTTLEPDFELTGNIAQFLDIVRGVFWKFVPNGYNTDFNYSIEITKSVYLEFQHVDIFSALNMIAKEFETEWFFDNWENTLTFGKAEFTDKNRVPLQVGINVGLPSVTKNSDEYYNTFYVFGSTRNIQQDYQGNNINSIVNKRLTLPSRYKDSCYETDENLNVGERYSTPLIFDDVYPRATEGGDSRGIKIENVRARILYKIDEETGDKIQIGTNSSGPIYETYTKYYFRIPEDKLNLTEDDIFPDAELKCSFETGSLAGYEFVLKAFFEETRLDTAEGQPLTVYKGDFEIQYIEEGNVIIPNQTSFAPREGDEVAFFNIKLPNEYVLNAQKKLLQRTIEEVERRKTNYNVYQVSSNPVAFAEADPILRVGSPVLYVDDTTTLETRVTKIVKKLDYSFEQTITVGNKKYQGPVSKLKEEIQLVSTNQRVIEATSKMTEEMLQAYKRTQDAILQGFNRIANMWQFDDEGNVFSEFNVYSLKAISTKGLSVNEGGTGGTGIDIARMWEELASDDATKLINLSHMPSSVKTAVNWVSSVTRSDADSQINKWNEIVSFLSGISDTSSLSSILSGKANTSVVTALGTRVTTIESNYVAKTRKISAGTGLTGGGDLSADRTLSLATIGTAGTYTKVVVDAYGRVTGNSTLLESDIPALSISKITNLQSTINTINANFANYLPLTGGVMKNTNLVTNLNADLLDGYNADDLFKGRLNINSQISVSAEGWYTIASITTNGFNERGTIHFAIRTTGGDFRPYVTHYYINSSWAAGESNIFTNGIGGFITGIRLTQTGNSNAGGTRNIELCFSRDFTGYLIVLYSAYDNDGIINDNFTWNIGALPIADTSAEVWKTLDLYHGINTDKQIRTTNALYADSVVIGGVTLSWDTENQMLRFSKGGYFLGPVSTKGVSNETGTGGTGVALSAVWDSLANNTDAHGSTKIHLDHIPTLTKSKISDFPTLVSAFANDAGYITASAIINKADKATTLAGYGITDAIPYLETSAEIKKVAIGYGYYDAGFASSGGFISAIHHGGKYGFQLNATNTGSDIWYRGLNNGIFTEWKRIAFLDDVVTLSGNQTITGEKVFQTGGGSNVPLRIRNTADSAHIQAGSSGTNNTASLTISGLSGSMLTSLQVYATNTAFHGSISTSKIRGITDSSMVANLNANYLGGLNKDSFQKAVYDYVNVSGTADTTALPTVLAPSIYNGTNSIGGNFKFYDTKFFSTQTNTSNRCQLAYGYDIDSIHYRRYSRGKWSDWKKVVFTDVDSLTPASGVLTINGALKATGNSLLMGALNVNGNVNLSSMVMTNNDNGVLTLDGNYIDVNAPMNVKTTMKIGNATLSYDYASGMLLIDKGIASSGAISTKGISNASAGIASAQFGLIYEDYWRMATNSELSSYGATATLFSGDNATNNGTIVIACDAFNNKTIADVDVFVVGYGEAPSSAMALVPYKIDGNKCYFRLNATQLSGFTGFKIKVY